MKICELHLFILICIIYTFITEKKLSLHFFIKKRFHYIFLSFFLYIFVNYMYYNCSGTKKKKKKRQKHIIEWLKLQNSKY